MVHVRPYSTENPLNSAGSLGLASTSVFYDRKHEKIKTMSRPSYTVFVIILGCHSDVYSAFYHAEFYHAEFILFILFYNNLY